MTSENIFTNLNDEIDNSVKYSNSAINARSEPMENTCEVNDRLKPFTGFEFEKKRNTGMRICSNCGTSSTSTWRNLGDQIVCNSCKCFYRKHGKNRPIHMRKDTIITRHRKVCKLSVPNEVVFTVKDAPNQNSLEFDSGAVAEVMCLMLQYLRNP